MPWQRMPTKQSSRKAIYATLAYCMPSSPKRIRIFFNFYLNIIRYFHHGSLWNVDRFGNCRRQCMATLWCRNQVSTNLLSSWLSLRNRLYPYKLGCHYSLGPMVMLVIYMIMLPRSRVELYFKVPGVPVVPCLSVIIK